MTLTLTAKCSSSCAGIRADMPSTRCPAESISYQSARQANLQNRWISRQVDAQPDVQIDMQTEQAAEQLTRLRSLPYHTLRYLYSKVPNTVSAKNPWHRWASNWRYRAGGLRDA